MIYQKKYQISHILFLNSNESSLKSLQNNKTIPQISFLKIYVMSSAGIDLYDIAHVKVDFIPLQKMYVMLHNAVADVFLGMNCTTLETCIF